MFESGAISNAKLSRVCPLLFQVEPAQLRGPLNQFQATPYNQAEVRKLIFSINESSEAPLNEAQLNRTFDRCWPELAKLITEALNSSVTAEKPQKRTQEELIEEILSTVRTIANQNPDEESVNHWFVLFRSLIDFGNQMCQVANSKSDEKELEMLKFTLNHLRLALNLAMPKISKTSKHTELANEAKSLMSRIELAVNVLEIPF